MVESCHHRPCILVGPESSERVCVPHYHPVAPIASRASPLFYSLAQGVQDYQAGSDVCCAVLCCAMLC